jgi:uncharacterized phiE125 gp8 family phage protein
MGLQVVTAAAIDPVSLDEAKTHLHYSGSDEDAYIRALIRAATDRVEIDTRRVLITRTLKATFECFPCDDRLCLEKPPLVSVSSVKYRQQSDGQLVTLSASAYEVDTISCPGLIQLKQGYVWPSLYYAPNPVEVTYSAGFGLTADLVPQSLKQGILYLVAHWFGSREPVANTSTAPIPMTYEWIIGPERAF